MYDQDKNKDVSIETLNGHTDSVLAVAWSLNNTRVASGSDDNTIKLWDTQTTKCLSTLSGHGQSVMSVA